MKKIKTFSFSHKGRREKNEDFSAIFKFRKNLYVLAVCDGMGGYEGGQIASKLAIKELKVAVKKEWDKVKYDLLELKKRVNFIFEKVNNLIYEKSKENSLNDMGTTIVALFIQDGKYFISHIGDSRCYLVQKNDIRQLTEDHSIMADSIKKGIIKEEEAQNHPYRHAIYKNLGKETFDPPDIYPQENKMPNIPENSIFLLCTDGIHSFVEDIEILKTIEDSISLKEASFNLANLAIKKKSNDNMTINFFEYGRFPRSLLASKKRKKYRILNLTAIFTLVVFLTLFTFLPKFIPIKIPSGINKIKAEVIFLKDDNCQLKIDLQDKEKIFLVGKKIILRKKGSVLEVYVTGRQKNILFCNMEKKEENLKEKDIVFILLEGVEYENKKR